LAKHKEGGEAQPGWLQERERKIKMVTALTRSIKGGDLEQCKKNKNRVRLFHY